MADIELVIKVPEELYKAYKGRPPMLGDTGMDMIAQAIANGTPLPKGHGRLIDADELRCEREDFDTYFDYSNVFDEIDNAPTIIEADKAESEVSE